ncbi:hypothetical protein MJO29_007649 [Puccinia striiformis f. sp. tritici]|nr:hypothetical protein MJO29_007649 [Puccinia striiformis f. sp. tritici]
MQHTLNQYPASTYPPVTAQVLPMGISSARQNPGQVAKPGKHDNLRPGLANTTRNFPPPNSCRVSGKWDHSKKALALHLVTKMNQMRNSQGYSSMIIDVHSKSLSLSMEDEAQAEQLNLDSTT